MSSDRRAFPSACETLRKVTSGEQSPVEVIETALRRVEALNSTLNAVVTLSDTAIDQARDLEARLQNGETAGPLCGLPVGIKDVTPVCGLRHTYGSLLYADNIADVDAVVVQRLRNAGAIILGKTNTPEFATGANTFNEVFGATRNPWNHDLSAGGSTGGGAAALAAGMIDIAEGTDLGGSLRIPASFCGVVGLRPTPGLVPTWPSDYAWDTMLATGLMARTAEDLAMVLQVVAGPSPRAPIGESINYRSFVDLVQSRPVKGMRLAYCGDVASIGIDPDVDRVCREAIDALAAAGAIVEEINFDLSYARAAFLTLRGYWMVVQQHARLQRCSEFGDNLRNNVEVGLETTTMEFAAAEQVRGRVWEQLRQLFCRFDHLLTPTMAISPFAVEQNYPETIAGKRMETYIDWVAPTFLLSLAGLPVVSVPAGLDASGMPVGLQVVAGPGGEGHALSTAAAVQALRPIGVPALLDQ